MEEIKFKYSKYAYYSYQLSKIYGLFLCRKKNGRLVICTTVIESLTDYSKFQIISCRPEAGEYNDNIYVGEVVRFIKKIK